MAGAMVKYCKDSNNVAHKVYTIYNENVNR